MKEALPPEMGVARSISASAKPCAYHRHHSPQQLVTQLHHIFPVYLQHQIWADATRDHPHDGELVPICGTGHDSVHAIIDRLISGKQPVPPSTPKRAWGAERALAAEGVRRFVAAGGHVSTVNL